MILAENDEANPELTLMSGADAPYSYEGEYEERSYGDDAGNLGK